LLLVGFIEDEPLSEWMSLGILDLLPLSFAVEGTESRIGNPFRLCFLVGGREVVIVPEVRIPQAPHLDGTILELVVPAVGRRIGAMMRRGTTGRSDLHGFLDGDGKNGIVHGSGSKRQTPF